MPEVTYILQFTHRDPADIPETIEYTALVDAWKSVRLFAEPDSAEIYTRIDLIAHNWAEGTETTAFTMTWLEANAAVTRNRTAFESPA